MTDVLESPAARTLDRLDDAGRAVLFTEARTANTFAPTPVTDAELREIWDLAKWPPTAANTQPLRVLYVRSAEGRARLVEHMNDGNKAKTATAPAVAVLAVDSRFHEHIPAVLPYKPELKEAFETDEAMRGTIGRFSGALQAGYFIMAVRAHGLAAGPMGGFDRGRDRRRLLPRRPVAFRPGRQHRPPGRRSVVRPAPPPRSRRRVAVGLRQPPYVGQRMSGSSGSPSRRRSATLGLVSRNCPDDPTI